MKVNFRWVQNCHQEPVFLSVYAKINLINANQWYLITSWLGEFNPKLSGAWGRSPRWGCGEQTLQKPGGLGGRSLSNTLYFIILEQKAFFVRFFSWLDQNQFQKILRKNNPKNNIWKKKLQGISFLLQSSETYPKQLSSKSGKTKLSHKLKIIILLNKNLEIFFLTFQNIAHLLWPKTQ